MMHVPHRVRDFRISIQLQQHDEDFFACFVGEQPHRQAQVLPRRHVVALLLHVGGNRHDQHSGVFREASEALLQCAMNGRPGCLVTIGKERSQGQGGKGGGIIDMAFQQPLQPLLGLPRLVQPNQKLRLRRDDPRIVGMRLVELLKDQERLAWLIADLQACHLRHVVDNRGATELELFTAAARTGSVDVDLHRAIFLERVSLGRPRNRRRRESAVHITALLHEGFLAIRRPR